MVKDYSLANYILRKELQMLNKYQPPNENNKDVKNYMDWEINMNYHNNLKKHRPSFDEN